MRERRFRVSRFGRRGLDPSEVRQFLAEVAEELAATEAELRQAVQENTRVKQALRQWQSAQARAQWTATGAAHDGAGR